MDACRDRDACRGKVELGSTEASLERGSVKGFNASTTMLAGQGADRPGGAADRWGRAIGGRPGALGALVDLVEGTSPNSRGASRRAQLPASLARVPVGPAGQATPGRAQWNIEDVTVLLNGIQEYGSAVLFCVGCGRIDEVELRVALVLGGGKALRDSAVPSTMHRCCCPRSLLNLPCSGATTTTFRFVITDI